MFLNFRMKSYILNLSVITYFVLSNYFWIIFILKFCFYIDVLNIFLCGCHNNIIWELYLVIWISVCSRSSKKTINLVRNLSLFRKACLWTLASYYNNVQIYIVLTLNKNIIIIIIINYQILRKKSFLVQFLHKFPVH